MPQTKSQKNPSSVTSTTPVTSQSSKNTNRGGFKKAILFFMVLLFCITIFSGIIGFFWMGGFLKDWTCNIVHEDSMISSKFECEKTYTYVEDGDTSQSEDPQYSPNNDNEANVINVVDQSIKSVVGIGVYGDSFNQEQVVGTGFIVDSSGWVVTNQHVVSNGEESDYFIVLHDNQEQISVTEIYRDEVNDIAIVKVDQDNLPALKLGDSDNLQVGQTSIAIGNPLGSLSGTVTVGVVSALDRDVEVGTDFNFGARSYSEVIQTDASINPGNSGGPLINSKGEVIGVNFATVSGADNLSFALPINRVKGRITEVKDFGGFRIPFLGVEYQRRLVFYENESLVGAVVSKVVEKSPADKGGLKINDVIVQFDGESLEDDSLVNLIQKSNIGDDVEVVVIRNGEIKTIKIKIGDRNTFDN